MWLCISLSRILNGTLSNEIGLYDLGSCVGLFGFERATPVPWRQVFGSLEKPDVKSEHSQAVVFSLYLNLPEWPVGVRPVGVEILLI